MAFEALDDFLDESLLLPIGGRTYVVPAPSAEVGLRTQALVQASAIAADGGRPDERVLADAAERDLYRDLLGPAYDEMLADEVRWPALKHAAITVLVWTVQDREAAERFWHSPVGAPSHPAPPRPLQGRSGGASTTRSPGSGSGTSTRPVPARRGGGTRRR